LPNRASERRQAIILSREEKLMVEIASFGVIVVDRRLYARARDEVERGEPHPIAKAVFGSVNKLNDDMRDREYACALCGASAFNTGEAPAEYLVVAPDEESEVEALAGPVCARCAALGPAAKRERAQAAMQRLFPEGSERKAN
jgi:hypothetical protein